MQTELDTSIALPQRAGYFRVPGADLYTVLHEVTDPVARVLMIGPFASERHNSYLPWVRWARYLAARQIEVLRYDYRGVGESTGNFEEMTFVEWTEDACVLAAWLQARSPDVPLFLHGFEIGGILASKAFVAGLGDALLLWAPPASARDALRATLLHWLGLNQISKFGREGRSAKDYIRQLEEGAILEVDGYPWSSRLWREAASFYLSPEVTHEGIGGSDRKKPIRIVALGRQVSPVAKGGALALDEGPRFDDHVPITILWHSFKFWSEFRAYFSCLFSDNFDWLVSVLEQLAMERK